MKTELVRNMLESYDMLLIEEDRDEKVIEVCVCSGLTSRNKIVLAEALLRSANTRENAP